MVWKSMMTSSSFRGIFCFRIEPQFSDDQSFLGNYGLKMYGFRDTESQSPWWHHHYSEGFFSFFGPIFTYISLEPQFNAEQSFLGNHGLKMHGFWDTKSLIQPWRHHISNRYFHFSQDCILCTVNFTPIKIFLGKLRTVLVWEGGHTLQFQQPRTQDRFKSKNGIGYEFAFSKFSFAYENSRLKQIFLFADYD